MPENRNSTTEPPFSTKNLILNNLPAEELARLQPQLEPFEFVSGDVLYHHDQVIDYAYFPHNAMVSVVATAPNGVVAEVGVVGQEGLVGVDVLLGADRSYNQTIVQLPDGGYRIRTATLREEFNLGGALQKQVLKFTRLLMIQLAQTALCNRLHTVEERLARWLLLSHDRSPTDKLPLTQEFLAIMLGVNRPSVTMTAIVLQAGGFISYVRGKITVLDREGLEQFACDCYRTVKEEYDRVQR